MTTPLPEKIQTKLSINPDFKRSNLDAFEVAEKVNEILDYLRSITPTGEGKGWRCGKCDGANLPEHSRRCDKRTPEEKCCEKCFIERNATTTLCSDFFCHCHNFPPAPHTELESVTSEQIYCSKNCFEMTTHINGKCLKCKDDSIPPQPVTEQPTNENYKRGFTEAEFTQPVTPESEWEKDVELVFAEKHMNNEWRKEEIKSLIRLVLSQTRQSAVENYKERVVKEIEKLKKEEDWNKLETGDYYAHEKIEVANKNKIYNRAIEDAISILTSPDLSKEK